MFCLLENSKYFVCSSVFIALSYFPCFSNFEIHVFKFRNPGFRNLKNRTISVFSEVFQRQTQRKKQRDKTMENTNGNTMENTKENTWSVFTKRTHNDFPCGYDKSQRLLTRNSEKKRVRVNLQKMLFEIIENVHFIHVFH